MPVFNNALAGAAGSGGDAGFKIERSLRFNPEDGTHLSREPQELGNRRTFTLSLWAKRSSDTNHDHLFQSGNSYFRFQSSGELIYYWNGSDAVYTTKRFVDFNAWYHVVLVVDTTQASTTHRVKMWVNGVQEPTTGTWMNQNNQVSINNTAVHYIGSETANNSVSTFDGYMAECHFLDGIAITSPVGVFGEFDADTGVWNPIEATFESPNNGTVWSGGKTGSDLSGYPAENGFDGNTSTWFYAASNQTTTFTFSPAITGTKFEIWALSGGNWPEISVNGTGIGTHNSVWVDVSSQANGSLSTIACPGASSAQSGFTAVRVDGVILVNKAGKYGTNGFKLVFDPAEGLGDDSHGGVIKAVTTSNITAVSTSTVGLGGSSTGNNGTSLSEVNNAFDNNTSTFFGFGSGGSSPDQIKEWTFSTGLPVKAGDVVSYEGTKGAGFKAGVFLANGQVVGGNYPYPNVDSVTASSDTTITKINAGSFGGGNQYSNIRNLTINGVPYPLNATELTLTDTTGLLSLSPGDVIEDDGSTATGTIHRISGTTVDVTQTTNTWGTGSTATKAAIPITNDWSPTNFLTATGKYLDDFTGTERSGFPWSQAFDGRLYHGAVPNAGSSWTFTPSTPIPFSTLAIYAYKDSSPGTLRINGTDVTSQVPNHNGIGPNQRTVITGISSPITSIQNISNGGLANIVFAGLEINGSLLLDRAEELDVFVDSPTNFDADSGNPGGNYCTWNFADKQSEVTLSNGNLDVTFTGANGHSVSGNIAVRSGKWYWEVTVGANTSLGIHEAHRSTWGSRWTGGRDYSWGYAPNGQIVHNSSYTNYGTGHTEGDVIGVAFDADNGKLYFSLNNTWQNQSDPANGTNPAFSGLDTTIDYVPHIGYWTSPGYNVNSANFGQRSWKYSAPSGYKAICTQNFPDPAVKKSSEHFDISLWTGNGKQMKVGGPKYSATSTLSSPTNAFNGNTANGSAFDSSGNSVLTAASITITSSLEIYHNRTGSDGITVNINGTNYTATGLPNNGWHSIPIPSGDLPLTSTGNITIKDNISGAQSTVYGVRVDSNDLLDGNGDPLDFSPDFVWLKSLQTTNYHMLFDTERGAEARLHSNVTSQEQTGNGDLTAFNSDGYTLDNNAGNANTDVNQDGIKYVGWAWEGGTSFSNSAGTNGATHASSGRANKDAGFSIVKYVGTNQNMSIRHGLDVAPELIICKSRDSTQPWVIGSKADNNWQNYLHFDNTGGGTLNLVWQNTAPTSQVFTVGATGGVNATGEDFIAYCFAPSPGFSAMGKYIGNGNVNGNFIYTGFKVAFLMRKNLASQNWLIHDRARDPENPAHEQIYPSNDSGEYGFLGNQVDLLSNGFKIRGTNAGSNDTNASSEYLYLAFAENPFKYARGN